MYMQQSLQKTLNSRKQYHMESDILWTKCRKWDVQGNPATKTAIPALKELVLP